MSHRPCNLDDNFLAPVPTWLVGEMFTAEYPGAVQLAPGRHEFIEALPPAVPVNVPAAKPRLRRKREHGNGIHVQRG